MPALKLNLKAVHSQEIKSTKNSEVTDKTRVSEVSKISTKITEKRIVEEEIPSWIHSFSLPKSQQSIDKKNQDAIDLIEDEKKAMQAISDEKDKKPKEKIEFHNYESSFSKQSNHIIKKLRNFRYTPKTRVWFIIWLTFLSFGTLWILMLAFPEKHSLEIYKASIINIYNADENIQYTSTHNKIQKATTDTPADNDPQIDNQEQKERLRKHLLEKYSK